MTPGISFHRGGKQLKLVKSELEKAIEFPEEFEFKNEKEARIFFKNFTDDVTRFDEKVSHSTHEIYDSATNEIATWILEDPKAGAKKKKALSVFSPNESIGNLRTALVQCNFTDISRLTKDFRKILLENSEEDKEIKETIVTENDAIHEIIDKISELSSTPNTIRVIMIQQFESLRPRFVDSLISLLYSNSTCRSVIPRVRLMICVSTSPAFFTQNCEMETINMLELKQFQFIQLEEVFAKVISKGIHAFFEPPRPKPKNIEEDDPKLLMNFDCAPALFSGPFMVYLKNRFWACDYSVSALTRAVQFALLQKYVEYPLWREETHSDELKKYDTVLRLYQEEFGNNHIKENYEFIHLHMEIQSDPEFWKKTREDSTFREKKQFLFDGMCKLKLFEFCDKILGKMDEFDKKFCEKLRELKEKLEEARHERSVTFGQPDTPITSSSTKMSFLELQKQRKLAMSAKQNNPISHAKSAIFTHIMALFEKTLRPYPATWQNVIGTWSSDNEIKTSLDSSDEFDIENCLLNTNTDEPVSVAWRALLCHRNFKMVPINDWAEMFLENIKLPKNQRKGAFFAAAGQLEHIGLIRGSAASKSTNVNVLYHPISFVPSL